MQPSLGIMESKIIEPASWRLKIIPRIEPHQNLIPSETQ
jgi:hypothetical protein